MKKETKCCVHVSHVTVFQLHTRTKLKLDAKLKVSPTSKSHEDWDQREPTTSESSLLWINPIRSLNTLSERLLKRTERQNLSHQKFNVLSLQSPFNANAEEWLTRDHVLNKPRR